MVPPPSIIAPFIYLTRIARNDNVDGDVLDNNGRRNQFHSHAESADSKVARLYVSSNLPDTLHPVYPHLSGG